MYLLHDTLQGNIFVHGENYMNRGTRGQSGTRGNLENAGRRGYEDNREMLTSGMEGAKRKRS
jgi:hypothetical protein